MKMIERIERCLAAKGIKQGELERSLGLSENRISKWKGGQGEPTARQAWKISHALGVPLEWLVSEDGPLDPPEDVPMFSPAEQAVAYVFRNSGLDLDTAIQRLGPLAGQASPPSTKAEGKRRRS